MVRSLWRVGVDSGGTFTDVCLFSEGTGEVRVGKVSSTPADPGQAIVAGVRDLVAAAANGSAPEVTYFGHGSTVATNALLQKRGVATGLITTAGFRDLLEIARQRRPDLYDLQTDKPEPLVRRDMRVEVQERVHYDGRIEQPLAEADVRRAVRTLRERGAQAIAICFLYSYINSEHEALVKRIVAEEMPEAFVSASSDVLPEFREYERLSTVVINAYLGPVMRDYLTALLPELRAINIAVPPHITQSNGGVISFQTAQNNPVRTVLSGPSTGVVAATYVAGLAGFENVISFDMGGTSTDVSLIEHGRPKLTGEMQIEGYPIRTASLDIKTVGAGGGSIAWIDGGDHLKVGPRSAGAVPGPVCYGLGNDEPTVTDANVVLGTLNPRALLGGRMPISSDSARRAIEALAGRLGLDVMATAQGIISVVTANMAKAIRVISVQRGYDPRDFTLVAFGGAGPLHAVRLAQELDIPRVLVPETPGILCALGLLLTDLRTNYSLTRILPATAASLDQIGACFADLERRATTWFDDEAIAPAQRRMWRAVDMRYAGQNYELSVPAAAGPFDERALQRLVEDFARAHEQMYGYTAPDEPVQAVTFRLEATGVVAKAQIRPSPLGGEDARPALTGERQVFMPEAGLLACPVYDGGQLVAGNRVVGPAIVEQMDSTTVVLPGHVARVDAFRNIIIEVNPA